ncbi:MAG: MlaD family protein [Vicinamibacteria bacterium]
MNRHPLPAILGIAIACGQREPPEPRHGGARLEVLFDERHGLEGGEPVRFHDFEVGRVESVDLAEARVRATLSVDPALLEQLTTETTFSVEKGDSRAFLLAHVLNPEAEKLAEGASVEGVDSAIELTLRQAGSQASQFLESVGSSEWVREVKGLVSEVERKVEEVDWGEKEQEVRGRLEEAERDLEKAAGETAEEAKESYRALSEQMKRIAEELEALGRSDEARKLEEQIERLFGKSGTGQEPESDGG